jgi:centromeric protein E
MSEDAFSFSDTHDMSYQDEAMDEPSAPLPRRPSNHVFDRISEYQQKSVASQSASEVSEEQCKEVQCIETNELRRRRSQESFHAYKLETAEKEKQACTDEEKHDESVRKDTENAIELYACDSDASLDIEQSNTDDEPLALKRCVVSSRDIALARSSSCKASFMVIPNSWFDDSMSANMTTPPSEHFKYPPRRPEKVRRSVFPEKVASDAVTDNSTGNTEEESAVNDTSCVSEAKQTEENDASQQEENQVQVSTDSSLSTFESPSRWPFDFSKKQREIIELWHDCHISIVHRTYFFLLFNGDHTDHIYMEVEHRRLSFIKSSFIADGEPNATIASRYL